MESNKRKELADGTRVRNYFLGFREDRFEMPDEKSESGPNMDNEWLNLAANKSIFDKEFASCKAQLANDQDKPTLKWSEVTTVLSDIDTTKVHYIQTPESHIVVDFDKKGSDGKKSLEENFKEASKWPPTYAELSKSGCGIHLHYNYTGDTDKLSRVFDDNIEIKVQTGNSSLRRRLTLCNCLPIASISSGLPLKGDKMVSDTTIKSEKSLRSMITRNLNKEIHDSTKPSVDFIKKILDDAYASGLNYDVSDMHNAILMFAMKSTNQADACIKLVTQMKFKSDEPTANIDSKEKDIVFFDVEVFPNLFICTWKKRGKHNKVVRMINPTPKEIESLIRQRLVGFNCRKYDNHILYARLMGYTNEQLYKLSSRIIEGKSRNCMFGEAYNLSYTDIYDFSSKKQSLKKFEIELGIHHQELGLPWDQPVPEDMWNTVAEYCDNDVLATEALFESKERQADFLARQILADLAGMTVNDTTNQLTTRIIFGSDKAPQQQFNYRDMGDTSAPHMNCVFTRDGTIYPDTGDEYTVFDANDRPIFPGYKYEYGKSTYRGEEVGEGGEVYAEPGMYGNVALLDIASMHPHSIIAEELFGKYTKNFEDLVNARIFIKHKEFDKAKELFGGRLAKYLEDETTAANLSKALKIAINSVYGLTAAKFDNAFRDNRNVDNIVAKRGALFMINLRHEVQKRGFIVAHIKTDSIKIPDATPEIIQFVTEYGHMYGYSFEHEETYEKMCLVNDAVYIAKYKTPHIDKETGKEIWWTATGTQFAVPYDDWLNNKDKDCENIEGENE